MNTIEQSVSIPFSEIPGFPVPTVEGHSGTVVLGLYHGVPLMALRGASTITKEKPNRRLRFRFG